METEVRNATDQRTAEGREETRSWTAKVASILKDYQREHDARTSQFFQCDCALCKGVDELVKPA